MDKQSKIQQLCKKINAAVDDLNNETYNEFLTTVFALGKFQQTINLKNNQNGDLINIHANETDIKNINNLLVFFAFLTAWKDDDLKKRQKKHLRAKAQLNQSTRQRISQGLAILAKYAVKNSIPSIFNSNEMLASYDNIAQNVIKNYKTKRQKFISFLGIFFAIFVALSGGLVSSVALITFLGTTWPVLFGAALLFSATFYVNWTVFKNAITSFFNALAGKDKLFAGFFVYFTNLGQRKILSRWRKFGLLIASLLSTSVGFTFGALTYATVIHLSSLSCFSSLAIGMAPLFLTPLGIIMAGITAIGMLALTLRAFVNILHTDNIKAALARPFKAIASVFSDASKVTANIQTKFGKYFTYIALTIISIISVIGLALLMYNCSFSLNQFLTTIIHVPSKTASIISYTISMGLSLLGQIPFSLEAAALMVAKIAKQSRLLFQSSNLSNPNSDKLEQPEEHYPLSQQLKYIIVNIMSLSSKVINAVGTGMTAVPHGLIGWAAGFTIGSATLRSLNFGFSAGVSKDIEAEEFKQLSSTARIDELIKINTSYTAQHRKHTLKSSQKLTGNKIACNENDTKYNSEADKEVPTYDIYFKNFKISIP